MQVSSELEITNGRILKEIGRITAASSWCGTGPDAGLRERALTRLIETAKEFDADAIIAVDYSLDSAYALDLTEIPVQRIQATGIAVKLARAA